MPNRNIREGILDSDAINQLSESTQNFYFRLLLAVDDAGRIDGRLPALRSKLYPISEKETSEIGKHLSECHKHGVIIPYIWDDKPILQVSKWHRAGNSLRSKLPDENGVFEISYVLVQTRDGNREFVASSIKKPQAAHGTSPPYHPHQDPIPTPYSPHTDEADIHNGVRPPSSRASATRAINDRRYTLNETRNTNPTPIPPETSPDGSSSLNHSPHEIDATNASEKANGNDHLEMPTLKWRLGNLFGRKPNAPRSDRELKQMKRYFDISEGDLQLIETYYQAKWPPDTIDPRRRDLYTLLANFPAEMDRARKFKPHNGNRTLIIREDLRKRSLERKEEF
jgi:hypothetical protein